MENSAGGTGTFRYKLDDPDLTTGATVTTETSVTICGLTPGEHTLYLQEQFLIARAPDALIWSSAVAVTVAVYTVAAIPTLSRWGLFALMLLLMMIVFFLVRARRLKN